MTTTVLSLPMGASSYIAVLLLLLLLWSTMLVCVAWQVFGVFSQE